MSTILLLGERVRPMETIARVGEVLGYKRTTAFKVSKHWPLHGDSGERRVIVPKLAEELGIPYEFVDKGDE